MVEALTEFVGRVKAGGKLYATLMVEALTEFVGRVKAGGKLYATLYELHDTNVAQWAADAQRANKDLFMRGCVTNPSASESFYYELHGITPPKGVSAPRKQDRRVIAADALDDKSAPAGWTKEILSAGFAIIRGNRKLAEAYASHVLDVYDHFAWRVAQNDPRQKGDGFLKVKPDDWQAKYFNADGSIRVAQLRFWLSALS
jgi:hypothetical protein